METIEEPRVDHAAEREVKAWLRASVLSRGVSTPMKHLYMAYRLQGGRRSAREFGDVIVQRCKGLKIRTLNNVTVVEGVCPRWDQAELTKAIVETYL